MRRHREMPSHIDRSNEQDLTYDLSESDAWKAWARIGPTPENVVRWALGWLNQSPNSDSAWLALRREIGALGSMTLNIPSEHWADFIERKIKTKTEIDFTTRLPIQREADRFLSMLSGCAIDLLNGSIGKVGPLSVTVCIQRRDRKGALKSLGKKLEPSPIRITDEAIYKVLQALDHCGGLVNRCPECDELFLAERTNKMYCTIKCQNVVTSRRMREKQKKERLKKQSKRAGPRRLASGA